MRVVVAESDPTEAGAVSGAFRRHQFEVRSTDCGADAVALSTDADLLVLSVDLPDLHGLEVCRRIRLVSSVPIIGTAWTDAETDIVLGLRAGLDAWLTRPYGIAELLARAQAILRRTQTCAMTGRSSVEVGPLRIDLEAREVLVRGRAVHLARKEFDLLHLLATQPETVFSRRQIMSMVWEDDWGRSSRTIDTHVSSLRSKLGGAGAIRTVRGVGFCIGYASSWESS